MLEMKTLQDTRVERGLELRGFIIGRTHCTLHRKKKEIVGIAWGKIVLSILRLGCAVNLD